MRAARAMVRRGGAHGGAYYYTAQSVTEKFSLVRRLVFILTTF